MKNTTNIAHLLFGALPLRLPLWAQPFRPAVAVLLLMILTPSATFAGSATWKTNPTSGDWNTAANWNPATVPNGSSDIASFSSSNRTDISLTASSVVDGLVFNAGASSFTITISPSGSTTSPELQISGSGITNNSGAAQNFVSNGNQSGNTGSSIAFLGSATAGNGDFTSDGGIVFNGVGGAILFLDRSTAQDGSFTNNAGLAAQTQQGSTEFLGTSTAANGTFTNNGAAVIRCFGGGTFFYDASNAGNATIISNGGTVLGAEGATTIFAFTASAGDATLVTHGGLGGKGGAILFYDSATGGNARVELFENGFLDIGFHDDPGVTVGSIEGNGDVFLGARVLTVGSNDRSTIFTGIIQDGGRNRRATGGSLTKIGKGNLVLHHRNTYTGGTTVKRGKLLVNNSRGSGTGSGPVQVEGGRLGGRGTIAGAVSVGNGNRRGAVLSPGSNSGINPGTLTIQSTLTFNSDGTYKIQLNSSPGKADAVSANGVTINSAAQFTFIDFGSATLAPGTVFTVINNNAATPITGAFGNLPDGSTFTSNGNNYKASYEGGDGNDLTLTVVP